MQLAPGENVLIGFDPRQAGVNVLPEVGVLPTTPFLGNGHANSSFDTLTYTIKEGPFKKKIIIKDMPLHDEKALNKSYTFGMGQQPQLPSEVSQQVVSSGHSDTPSLHITALTSSATLEEGNTA